MTTIDVSVSAGADDGKTGSSSGFDDANQNWMGNYYGAWNSWFRFTGISGLAGSTIVSAYISNELSSKNGSPNVRIYAERASSPTAPTSTTDYNNRNTTSAYASWTGDATPSPSLVNVIQELADDFDPTAILLLVKDNGSAANENYYEYFPYDWAGETTLHIEYTTGGGDVNPGQLVSKVIRADVHPAHLQV